MNQSAEPIRLSDDDIEFLLSVLRNATEPVSTAQLIEALRSRGN